MLLGPLNDQKLESILSRAVSLNQADRLSKAFGVAESFDQKSSMSRLQLFFFSEVFAQASEL